MKKILVTGANGQLGKCIRDIYDKNKKENMYIHFMTKDELDISDKKICDMELNAIMPDIIINCAAYTNVNECESEEGYKKAVKSNIDGVSNIAQWCENNKNCALIHISTDYVYDGKSGCNCAPYAEFDNICPINNYGKTKREGEKEIEKRNINSIIIRTSWLYSEYGKNFFNTIVSKIKNNIPSTVVCDQIGTPTNAHDLADFIFYLIENNFLIHNDTSNVVNFSNDGACSWYDFAYEIASQMHAEKLISCSYTDEKKSIAKRPFYSVMNKKRLNSFYSYKTKGWKHSLKDFMKELSDKSEKKENCDEKYDKDISDKEFI